MSKFKVGDKVKITDRTYGHEFYIGEDVIIAHVGAADYLAEGAYSDWYIIDSEAELIHPDIAFTIGQTYKAASGRDVTCIALREDGGMFGVFGTDRTSAYGWDGEGNYLCAVSSECPPYRIVFEPVRETVTVKGSFNEGCGEYVTYHSRMGAHKFTLTIDKLDGEFDWTTAKVTPCT